MTISHVEVAGLKSVDVLGRMPRTEAEAKALVRELNAAERRHRERQATASTQRQAACEALARQTKARPSLRRDALNVAASDAARNKSTTNVFDLYRERDAQRLANPKGA